MNLLKYFILSLLLISCFSVKTELDKNINTQQSENDANTSADPDESTDEVDPIQVVSEKNKIQLKWQRPSLNTDGSPLMDLKGFKIQYTKDGINNTQIIDVGNITQYEIKELTKGKYHFFISTYDQSGNHSPLGSFGEVEVK